MKYKLMFLLCLSACAAESAPAQPAGFQLGFPVDCTLGETCWLMNYVDHDDQDGEVKDANCEARSYDGHKGTDVAIGNWNDVLGGVDIIAPAAGTVLGARDGEADQFATSAQRARILARGRECGNGVRIDHGEGWVTQYCHMKKGSVSVSAGDQISAGTKLGLIGMSGFTDHPHVHMTLWKDDQVIDPYTGRKTSESCGLNGAAPLWKEAMPYKGFAIYDAGFAAGAPNFKAIARGKTEPAPDKLSSGFVFYISIFGVRTGDKTQITITQPDGSVFANKKITQKKNQARRYHFVGRQNTQGRFMTGEWTAKALVYRPDTGERQTITRTIRLTD